MQDVVLWKNQQIQNRLEELDVINALVTDRSSRVLLAGVAAQFRAREYLAQLQAWLDKTERK